MTEATTLLGFLLLWGLSILSVSFFYLRPVALKRKLEKRKELI